MSRDVGMRVKITGTACDVSGSRLVWYGFGTGMGASMGMDVLARWEWLAGTGLAGLAGWACWLIRCYNDMICPLRGGIGIGTGLGNGPCLSGTDETIYLLGGLVKRDRHCVEESSRQSSRAAEMRRNGCNSVRLDPIQSSPTQSGMPARSSSIRGKFGLAVHLAQLPAERGACAAARTVGITHSLGSPWGGEGLVLHHRVWPEQRK